VNHAATADATGFFDSLLGIPASLDTHENAGVVFTERSVELASKDEGGGSEE
jgi:hypothetical protein